MADFKFEFKRDQINKISRKKIIAELEKVAKHFNYTDFTQGNFDKVADVSSFRAYKEFGSWKKALQFLADHLKKKGIDFQITRHRHYRGDKYSMQEIFNEMEKIWVQLGHRPSFNEWVANKPKISYDTISDRFGGWVNACLKFIEYKSGGVITEEDETQIGEKDQMPPPINTSKKTNENGTQKNIEKTRTIPLKLRVKILNRDNFRCVFCGKSPATDIVTKLQIDHIIPFSKGGTNLSNNLQTLCEQCNLGKSNTEMGKEFAAKLGRAEQSR